MRTSVALATYNGEKFIEKQLYSILNQRLKVDEVVISDDGSQDNTLNIILNFINRYKLTSWKVISGKVGGVVANFTRAFSYVTGDIIYLCDQDDIWYEEKNELILQCFEENSTVLSINSSFEYIDTDDNIIYHRCDKGKSNHNLIRFYIEENAIIQIPLSVVINKNISPGMTMAVRKNILDDYLTLNLNKSNLHDHELNCLAAMKKGCYFYNKKLAKYRIHGNQTVSISNIKKRRIRDILYDKIRNADENIDFLLDMIKDCYCIKDSCDDEKIYLDKLHEFAQIRQKVVSGKIYMWGKEIIYWQYQKKYIDFRYCLIDLIAGMKLIK